MHASAKAGGILVRRAVVRSTERGRMFYTRSIDAWPRWRRDLERESGLEIPLWKGGDHCFFAHEGRARSFAARLAQESSSTGWEELREAPAFLAGLLDERPWRIFRFPEEMCLDPNRALAALLEGCRRLGVELRYDAGFGCPARTTDGWKVRAGAEHLESDLLVVAAGPWSARVLQGLGWQARTVGVRGQIALLPEVYPGHSMVHLEDSCYCVPRDGCTLLGATSEVGQWQEETTREGLSWLQARMRKLFPQLDLSIATRTWAGIRPRSADRVPHLGWLEPGRLLVASGHYRSGISMAPLTGSVVAQLARGDLPDAPVLDLDPLRPGAGYRPIG
jgi:glycine oxidase